jgi:2-oxoglutarate ferredoxin oxidoreductase subunit alpha
VIVDVQRAGPSTGQATRPGSADLMQAKWGPHSDNEMIALSPWSVQEMYDMTIRCFNLAERFRVPTILLADETVGHLREKFQVPGHLTVFNRDRTKGLPPFDTAAINGVPPLPAYGEGAHLLVTGSTHDGWGFRKTTDSKVQEKLTNRLQRKIRDFAEQEIIEVEEYGLTPLCEGVIIANGFTARAALRVVNELQAQGKNIGLLRLKTIWPFAEQAIARLDLMPNLKWIVVPEMNRGQIVGEVMKYTNKEIIPFNKTNGEVIYPEEIRQVIRKLL